MWPDRADLVVWLAEEQDRLRVFARWIDEQAPRLWWQPNGPGPMLSAQLDIREALRVAREGDSR